MQGEENVKKFKFPQEEIISMNREQNAIIKEQRKLKIIAETF